MLKRWSCLAVGMIIVSSVFTFAARAEDEVDTEVPLDLTLRTKAAAVTAKTADGSVLESPASHVYLVDSDTGAVLADKAGDQKMYPSSMTKIMTLYVLFDRLKQGSIALDSQFTVSEKAWRMQGSKMFVPLGGQVSLEDLIRGIAIQSGNDACVVAAEGIAGSEDAFAKIMNDTAKKIDMTNSNFTDASGWPHPDHTTTAHDMAVLGEALINDFPEYYHYLSEREYTYNGIRQFNRNLLLGNPSLKVDGIKTGHTEAAGYGITLSAKDLASNRRLVLVINGLDSEAARAQEGERLLKWGFANFHNIKAFSANAPIANAKVWMGSAREIPLTAGSDVVITAPKGGAAPYKASVTYQSPLIAPVVKGAEVGKLNVTFADGSTKEFPLVAAEDASKLDFLARIPRALGL
jgi:D-alanyl-D-alanine carboxypeptidase (penicillin-binding protein 5/6)